MGKEVCIVKKAFLRAAVLAAALILTLSISPAARGDSAVFSIFSEVTISPSPAPTATPTLAAPPVISPAPSASQPSLVPSPTAEPQSGFRLEVISAQSTPQPGAFRVLIYHTHTYEAYTATEAYPYTSKEKWRTSSPDRNVVAVGSYLTKLLTDAGVSVTHDTTPYEPPKLSTAYQRSLEMLQKRQQNGESYDLYIDLHRDAYSKGNGPNTVDTPSGASARLLMLIGKGTGQTGAGYDIKPDWESNRTIAQTLTNRLNLQCEGICRPVSLKSGRYNQHVAPCCVLIEVGNNQNTLEEALAAMPYLANAICALADGQIE